MAPTCGGAADGHHVDFACVLYAFGRIKSQLAPDEAHSAHRAHRRTERHCIRRRESILNALIACAPRVFMHIWWLCHARESGAGVRCTLRNALAVSRPLETRRAGEWRTASITVEAGGKVACNLRQWAGVQSLYESDAVWAHCEQ